MQRAKTKAEYQATAMLMGLSYSVITHVFYGEKIKSYIDADTLEPIETDKQSLGSRYHARKDDTFADGSPVGTGQPAPQYRM